VIINIFFAAALGQSLSELRVLFTRVPQTFYVLVLFVSWLKQTPKMQLFDISFLCLCIILVILVFRMGKLGTPFNVVLAEQSSLSLSSMWRDEEDDDDEQKCAVCCSPETRMELCSAS
jgi:hypothetical protein